MASTPRVALITGAGSGIGRATADAFYADGYAVMALDRDGVSADGWAAGKDAARAHAVQADVSDATQVETAVARTVEAFGGLDVLVNNAGVQIDGRVEVLAEETWHRV